MNDLEPRWLCAPDAARYISVSLSTFYRFTRQGSLPQPVYLSARLPRWDRLALDRMLAGDSENSIQSRSADADTAFKEAARALRENRPL